MIPVRGAGVVEHVGGAGAGVNQNHHGGAGSIATSAPSGHDAPDPIRLAELLADWLDDEVTTFPDR
jgi:hypothetical protein